MIRNSIARIVECHLGGNGPAILGPRIPSWKDLNKLLSGSLLGEISVGVHESHRLNCR